MTTDIEDQLRRAVLTIRNLKREVAEARAMHRSPIAVIGVGCRLPGGQPGTVEGPEALWRMLAAGTDAIVETPPARWDNDAWFDPDPDRPGKMNTRWGGFLSGLDRFDPGFFELSAREAHAMDPQQRLLLEAAWETLEDACIDPGRLQESATGVYVGINSSEYHDAAMARPTTLDAHALSGGVASVAAGRLAFLLGLQGPALAVDTACSSSLTAIHLAVQSLRSGECDMALAGGVYVVLRPNLTVALSKLHMMAPDGRCKSFDAAADGFVQGEGCVVVALKRLSDAVADNDPVRAVIRGSAANQDGRSGSLTAPSRGAQVRVIRAALADAGLTPDRVDYVETHGTGTALGDPIEAHALVDALGPERTRPVFLGALKSNIGHLGPAAGAAGFVKAVLAVEHGQIPANLHFRSLNPNIGWADIGGHGFPACFPDRLTDWPAAADGERVAGVSSFGFSGTNVHITLTSAPASAPLTAVTAAAPGRLDGQVVFAVSARTAAALDEALRRAVDALVDGVDLTAAARTSLLGRRAFEYRVAVAADSPAATRSALAARIGRPHHAAPLRPRLGLWLRAGSTLAAQLTQWGVAPAASEAGPDAPRKLRELGCTTVLGDAAVPGDSDPQYDNIIAWADGDATATAAILARLFTAGVPVDWRKVLGDGPRLRLPTYPFQRKSYWRPLDEPATAAPGSAIPPGDAVATPGRDACFRLTVGLTRFPWLGDHRVHQRALVPGAFQIACLAGAWRARRGAVACRIDGLTFAHPLALPENGAPESGDVELWTTLSPDGAASLDSRIGGADWRRHANAGLAPVAAGDIGAPLDLAMLRDRCAQTVAPDAWRARLAALGIAIGPAFQGIAELTSGDGEALARVVLPPMLRGARGAVAGLPHPALLDACLQVAGGAMSARLQGEALLPIGIDSVALAGDFPENTEVWAYARLTADGGVISSDITVADAAGRRLIDVRGLHVRRAPAAALADVVPPGGAPLAGAKAATLFHRVVWRPVTTAPCKATPVLPVACDADTATAFAALGPAWNPAAPLPEGGSTHIVDFQAWNAPRDIDPVALVAPAFALIKRLAAADSRGLVVDGYTLVARPHQDALRGLAATLALEHPGWRPRCVVADTVADAMAGLNADPRENLISVRDGVIQAARLVAEAAPPAAPAQLSGAVLITGGLGGLGRLTARWAAARGAGALILLGRKVDGADADDFVAGLRCPVVRIAADLGAEEFADGGALALLRDLAARTPPLRAIFHTVGVQRPGLLADLDEDAFAAALTGKARGAWALHRASVDLDLALDHFTLFSSLAGTLGAAGQGGYAAANAALDGLARQRRAMGLAGTSIAWGRFAAVGMATALDDAATARVDALGVAAMTPDTALDALDRALSAGLTDPLIAAVDWERFAARHPSGRTPPLLDALPERRPTPAAAAASTSDSAAKAGEDIAGWLIRVAAHILGADAADIFYDRPLFQLGLDSLMAVELRNRIAAEKGSGPSIAALLGGASLADIAGALEPTPPDTAEKPGADEQGADEEWEELTL